MTIVVPAISRKGAKNQLRRETGVPALPLYLRNGWRREEPALAQQWRVLVVAAPTKAAYFRRLGGPAKPRRPSLAGPLFSLTLRLSQWSKFTSRPSTPAVR